MTQINGWHIFHFRLFAVQLVALTEAVKALRVAAPAGYKSHPKTKLLASIYKCINEIVPAYPDHSDFRLVQRAGITLDNPEKQHHQSDLK